MQSEEQHGPSSWTIHELLERAREELRRRPTPPADSRASALPNLRTLRYYLAEGLVSPPTRLRGRVGLYGSQHLHELLAIKRLQALGRSLREIHELMTRAPDAALKEWAEPPPSLRQPRDRPGTEVSLAPGVRLVVEKPVGQKPRERRRIRRAATRLLREIRAQQRGRRGDR